MGVPIDDNIVISGEQKFELDNGGGTDLDSLDLSTDESSDTDLFVTKEDGGTAWVKKSFLKIWNYIKGKIGISSGGSANKFLNEQGTFTVVNSGKEYDIEFNADLDEVTLTEDNVDKTTLPLVATFIGPEAAWETLSVAEKAKHRFLVFNDDGGFGNAYDVPHGNSNVGDDLDGLRTDLDGLTRVGSIPISATGSIQTGTEVFSPAFTSYAYVMLMVRRNASDDSPFKGEARLMTVSKNGFNYTFKGNSGGNYYIDYIAIGK